MHMHAVMDTLYIYTCSDGCIYTHMKIFLFHKGEDYLPFLVLGSTPGVERVYLPTEDDAASGPIDVIGGLPTGDTVHTRAYVRQVHIYKKL